MVGLGYHVETTASAAIRHIGFDAIDPATPGSVPLFRVYNPIGGQHYLTYDGQERDHLVSVGWNFEKEEGNIFVSQMPGTTEVFRLYNIKTGDHLLTGDVAEKDRVLSEFNGVWVLNARLGFEYSAPAIDNSEPATSPTTAAAHSEAMAPMRSSPQGNIDSLMHGAADSAVNQILSGGAFPDTGSSSSAGEKTSRVTLGSDPSSATLSDGVLLDAAAVPGFDDFWQDAGRQLTNDLGGLLELDEFAPELKR